MGRTRPWRSNRTRAKWHRCASAKPRSRNRQMDSSETSATPGGPVRFPLGEVELPGELDVPENARGLVIFAPGSGSSRHSPCDRCVAEELRRAGHATLLFDLLTAAEERLDEVTAHLRFDIALLARRLIGVADWLDGAHPKWR